MKELANDVDGHYLHGQRRVVREERRCPTPWPSGWGSWTRSSGTSGTSPGWSGRPAGSRPTGTTSCTPAPTCTGTSGPRRTCGAKLAASFYEGPGGNLPERGRASRAGWRTRSTRPSPKGPAGPGMVGGGGGTTATEQTKDIIEALSEYARTARVYSRGRLVVIEGRSRTGPPRQGTFEKFWRAAGTRSCRRNSAAPGRARRMARRPGGMQPGWPAAGHGARRRPGRPRPMRPTAREVTAYHEAGHAVAALVLGRPVSWVSIRPDRKYLGVCAFAKAVFRPSRGLGRARGSHRPGRPGRRGRVHRRVGLGRGRPRLRLRVRPGPRPRRRRPRADRLVKRWLAKADHLLGRGDAWARSSGSPPSWSGSKRSAAGRRGTCSGGGERRTPCPHPRRRPGRPRPRPAVRPPHPGPHLRGHQRPGRGPRLSSSARTSRKVGAFKAPRGDQRRPVPARRGGRPRGGHPLVRATTRPPWPWPPAAAASRPTSSCRSTAPPVKRAAVAGYGGKITFCEPDQAGPRGGRRRAGPHHRGDPGPPVRRRRA